MKIAFIADTHLAPNAHAFAANCAVATAWIDNQGADLAIHLGDITADGVNHASHFPAARDALRRLRTPLRCVPGNHDIGDNPAPGGDSHHALLSHDKLALYRTTFGEDRWVWSQSGWTIIGLNALLFGLGDAEEEAQYSWLAATLKGQSGPIGLALHKPLFRSRPADAEIHPRYVQHKPRRRILDLVEGHDLRFVINGHTHQMRRLDCAGVEYVWAPSTAFALPDSMQEWIGDKIVGVLMLVLDADRHQFQLHLPPGLAQNNLADFMGLYHELTPARRKDEMS